MLHGSRYGRRIIWLASSSSGNVSFLGSQRTLRFSRMAMLPQWQTVTVPPTARGRSHVRVFIQGKSQCAVGAADVYIRPPAATTAAAKPIEDGAAGQ